MSQSSVDHTDLLTVLIQDWSMSPLASEVVTLFSISMGGGKAFLHILKYSAGGVLEPAKLYKLKHLSKVEVIANDPTGCTFMLGFDNLRSQSVAPPQWTMHNTDDRNRLLHGILNMCKEMLGRLPKVVFIDIVEMALRAKYAASWTSGSFDEALMLKNVEACEWLTSAIPNLEVPNLNPCYANMQAVEEKRADLEKLKSTFVPWASGFLRNYFASLVDFIISYKRQLKRPDHADLRYKCWTYAWLLQHLKSLDKDCLGPLRKAYCHSLNLLLRHEGISNELGASTKAPRNPTGWLEASTGSNQTANSSDAATISEAYSKMLTIFTPLLVDESSFFAHFMCFEVPALIPPVKIGSDGNQTNDYDMSLMAAYGSDEDFYAVVNWTYKIDSLLRISMHGITERYLSGRKADAAGFVRQLLDDLESRISMQFGKFVEEACHQIERNERNVGRLWRNCGLDPLNINNVMKGQYLSILRDINSDSAETNLKLRSLMKVGMQEEHDDNSRNMFVDYQESRHG
ncbi:Exocyst complex component Sec3 C-terminal protein [Dioscorea alata]|uniref:Exocyst complex component Sec3 C-terminal protein n=1 Tax=Dioscorea alata TaxID=55571 RepID=A0ACB7VXC8_DIOAL|nr:Exocyst complex component Sec3 C-terminal protein [Dioscorea alata]